MALYFSVNFMPLMIIIAIAAMLFINRDVKIPASKFIGPAVVMMIVLTITSSLTTNIQIDDYTPEAVARIITIHTFASTLGYVLRPFLTLIEILIILETKRSKILASIPAIINACVFSTALFGSHLAFYIMPNNHWRGGPLHSTIFIVQIFYLLLLLGISVVSFREHSGRKSVIILAMCIQAILASVLEFEGVEPSYSDSITALCILEYYIYLSTIYRQELHTKLDNYIGEVEASKLKLDKLTREVITAFANSIDAKDEYTHGHSSRVAQYSRRLAQMSYKSEEECEEIYYAALLHDIGKIGIPEDIITKEGKLSKEEYETIKLHPTYGAQILGGIKEFPYLSIGAKYHHERFDGKGYPEGRKGEDIPEMARIIAVADAYDAMSSKRSYRDPIPQQKVREEIVKGMGSQFDPDYARLMLHLIDEDLEYSMSEREEIKNLDETNELIVGEHRSTISDGVLINPFMTTITLTVMSDDEASGAFPAPSLIFFDSLDGKVHTDEKEIKDLEYFEYAELEYDFSYVMGGARKIEVREKETGASDIRQSNRYKIDAVRIRDHAMIRVSGKDKTVDFIMALPDKTRYMYLGLTGTHCRFTDINMIKSEDESPVDYIPRIAEEISYINGPVGDMPNVQVDDYRTAHSQGIPLVDGLKIKFHAKTLPTARLVWHCPFIDVFCSDDGVVDSESYRDLAFLRFDGECWECDPNCHVDLNVVKTDDFMGWDAWKEYNAGGYEALVLFKIEDDKITIITENAGISVANELTIKEVDKPLFVAVTGDQVAITNIRVS
ncbi:MAG: HD-GYP domain-containing protein [Lachnospiraceae bacterium]|nr:HD-GYP domain-containing protein [Lachnospiraceae bacterium]